MELLDLYTADREPTGMTMERGGKQPDGYYRLVVHICVFNSKGEMLIQQRQPFKWGWSGMWDVTVGGSAVAGDSSSAAAHRELLEEIGLDVDFTGIRPSLTVNFDYGFDDIYIIERDVELSELSLQYEEVKDVMWADAEKIKSMIDEGNFISYEKSFIDLLFFMREHRGVHAKPDKTVLQRS